MSRLVYDEIEHICGSIEEYDRQFRSQTGKTMSQVVFSAFGKEECKEKRKTAIVPVTCGLGLIENFSESVLAILKHIGADAFITEKTDVAGLQEAYLKGAEIVFMADDDVYSAFSLKGNSISDNGYATGLAFAAAMDEAFNCRDKTVLVLGAGPVGQAAVNYLCDKGAIIMIYDPIPEKTKIFSQNANIRILEEQPDLKNYSYILDATPIGNWITSDMINEGTVFSAPGMPLSLTDDAAKKVALIHNPLELGTIAMYYDCIFGEM